MRPVVALLAAVLLSGCAAVAAGDPNVAASVEGVEIPLEEVEQQFEQARSNEEFATRLDEDPSFGPQVQAQILTGLIQGKILQDWADDLGVEASESEVKEERDEVIEQLGGEEAFAQAVEQNGLTEEQVDEQLRQRVLQEKIADEVASDPVTDEAIEQFYEQNKETRFGGTATARHILVKDEKTANDALARLRKGEDFGKVAQELSTDTGSGAQGGKLPAYARGQTAPEFDEVLFSAPLNQLVGPVQTQFGFHLIEVLERSEARPLSAVEDEIREELESTQQSEQLQGELQERTKDLDIEVNPRFGEWDQESGQVKPVPALGDTSEIPSPGGAGGPSEPMVIPTAPPTG